MNVSVRVSGAQIGAKLGRLAATLSGPDFAAAGLAGAKVIEAEAKRRAPRRTGSLSRSIQSEIVEQGAGRFAIDIGTSLIYAGIQEFGGTIYAKNAPYLVFQTEDGAWHSVTQVTIPARPYLRPAADLAGPKAADVVVSLVKRVLEAA